MQKTTTVKEIQTIRQAMKHCDSRGVKIDKPDKYLHSHARRMKRLKELPVRRT